MKKKYKYLIDKLSGQQSAFIEKETGSSITIVIRGRTTKVSFYIVDNGKGKVAIAWIADYGRTGKLVHAWEYHSTSSQQSMVEEIESYVVSKTAQLINRFDQY